MSARSKQGHVICLGVGSAQGGVGAQCRPRAALFAPKEPDEFLHLAACLRADRAEVEVQPPVRVEATCRETRVPEGSANGAFGDRDHNAVDDFDA